MAKMSHPGPQVDGLEPLTRSRSKRWWEDEVAGEVVSRPNREPVPLNGPDIERHPFEPDAEIPAAELPAAKPARQRQTAPGEGQTPPVVKESWLARRGHTLSYVGIFLFTLVLYFRPYELFPSLDALSSLALVLAAGTLAIYLPTQFALEGNLTAMPVEIKLVIALTVAALISMPLGISVAGSWLTFTDVYIKAVLMFVVIVNVARTNSRLDGLLWLALAVGVMVSLNAMDAYRSGSMLVDGYRVEGTGRGMFGNPNDMALHLVIMTPIAIGMMLRSRAISRKIIYGIVVMLLIAGNVLTFSRAGFLGLAAAMAVLAWKLGKGRRLQVMMAGGVFAVFFMLIAPGNYGRRIASIFIPGLDPVGSSGMREGHLIQSIWITLRHPLTGIGMGNFGMMSNHSQVSHNAYTQVSSEMGLIALAIYVAFIIFPFWQLFKIESETRGDRGASKYYYLSVGLQAGIAGFMVNSFFSSVAYQWYIYYLIGYAVCLRRIYRTRPVRPAAKAQPLITSDAAPNLEAPAVGTIS